MYVNNFLFSGVRDVFDQLDKIFRVVGTPTEEVKKYLSGRGFDRWASEL